VVQVTPVERAMRHWKCGGAMLCYAMLQYVLCRLCSTLKANMIHVFFFYSICTQNASQECLLRTNLMQFPYCVVLYHMHFKCIDPLNSSITALLLLLYSYS
jgi:hypothetical protein